MNTFTSVLSKMTSIPLLSTWNLEEIAEKRGHQELYTRQSPEQLKRLREYAMIEGAVASNRIEGIEVDNDRVGTIVYYETLEQSSARWHEGGHDPWPYINYLLYEIDELYSDFENRFSQLSMRRGEKSANVISILNSLEGDFTVRELEFKCPGVSRETIKSVLKKHPDCFVCTGHGVAARWRRVKPFGE